MKASIFGLGTVGRAVLLNCNNVTYGYDLIEAKRFGKAEDLLDSNFCFICTPTPNDELGKQDISSIVESLSHLKDITYSGIVVIKSTVLPGTTQMLQNMFHQLKIVHNPEFLTMKNAVKDFQNQKTIIASGQYNYVNALKNFYYNGTSCKDFVFLESTKYEATEWAKYIHNTILPVKLSLLNEFHKVINDPDLYYMACRMAEEFGNLGNNYIIPGPDGKKGWGNACFPKDTMAILNYIKSQDLESKVLESAIEVNKKLRPEYYKD